MIKIAIIVGSTRPGRKAETVARWVHEHTTNRPDVVYEVVDLKDYDLPLLDEEVPPSMGKYSQPHTRKWAATATLFLDSSWSRQTLMEFPSSAIS